MKKVGISLIISVISTLFLFNSITFAVQVKLTIESYPPATLSIVSKIIDVPDPNDQLELSRQAALLALSSEGWALEDFGGYLEYRQPPEWSGHYYFVTVPSDVSDMFGYELNEEAGAFYLYFHNDEWASRLRHNICERTNNYGVISGGMGGTWQQCAVPDWGEFRVEPIYNATVRVDQMWSGDLDGLFVGEFLPW